MSIEALQKTYLFAGLSPAELADVDAISTEQPFQTGDRLIEAGKQNDSLWILLQGPLAVRDSLPGGLELDLFKLKPGDLFGEMSFADGLPASASVIAEARGKVLRLPFADLRTVLASHPKSHVEVLRKLTQTFSQRLRLANQQIGKGFLSSFGLVD